jgi:hypothetical protein
MKKKVGTYKRLQSRVLVVIVSDDKHIALLGKELLHLRRRAGQLMGQSFMI